MWSFSKQIFCDSIMSTWSRITKDVSTIIWSSLSKTRSHTSINMTVIHDVLGCVMMPLNILKHFTKLQQYEFSRAVETLSEFTVGCMWEEASAGPGKGRQNSPSEAESTSLECSDKIHVDKKRIKFAQTQIHIALIFFERKKNKTEMHFTPLQFINKSQLILYWHRLYSNTQLV